MFNIFSRKKKEIGIEAFCEKLLIPFLDLLNKNCTEEVMDALKSEPFTVGKNRKEIELELAMWFLHISGKIMSQINLLKNPVSPESLYLTQEMLNYFYEKWGSDTDRESFISNIRKEYLKKVKNYEFYENLYSESKMRLADLEAVIAVNLIGVNYNDLTKSFVLALGEIERGVTVIITGFFHDFKDKFQLTAKEEIN